MTSSQEQEQNVVDPVPDSFRGVLASLQHVVPKWQRLQNFTSAAKSAPSSKSNQNPRSASNQNYASTGDLRVLCAMGGGVGELHDNALRDYFFTELASNSSAFSKSADDLLFVVVPNAVSCPKNNYPIPPPVAVSSSAQNNNNDGAQINNKNDSASDTATPSSIGTGAAQSSPSVGNKIAGAFKMFGKKISNLVSSNKNSDDQQQNSSSSNNENSNKDFPSSPFSSQQEHEAKLEKLRQMAPDFLSLVTSTHLCADSHDPIAAGEYAIKSSTILVFRRGTNPLQTAVEKAMEYVKAYDAMLNSINGGGGATPSGGSRAGSVRQCSSGNLSNQANNVSNRNSSKTLLHDSNENMMNNADNNNDDDEDDELRRSTKHSSHQAYLADPPIRRLSSTDFDAANNSSPNESPNPTQQGQFGTNTSDASGNSSSFAAVPPTPPNYSQLLSIPREPNWFATVALNLSCQWPFYLNVAVVKMLRSTDLSPSNTPTPVAIRTVQRQVYPTLQPPRNIRAGGNFKGRDDREATNMFSESESSTTSFSYPDLHFSVDDFEEAFGDIRLAPGHKLAVLLTAGGPPNTDSEAVAVFRGVVNYENLMQQLKKQEQATGVALSSHPGASNNSSHFGSSSSSSGQFGSPSMAMKMNAPASPPAVVPLKSQSGRAEVAIWLTEADLEAQRFMQAHQQQQQQQQQEQQEQGHDEDHRNEHTDKNKKNATMGLQGTEILHCALTRVSLHASHVVSAMLQGVPWSSLHASWLPKQSNNPVTRNKWMIFPPTKEDLTKWLEDDNGFNRARAAAGTGTTSDDVRKMLGSGD